MRHSSRGMKSSPRLPHRQLRDRRTSWCRRNSGYRQGRVPRQIRSIGAPRTGEALGESMSASLANRRLALAIRSQSRTVSKPTVLSGAMAGASMCQSCTFGNSRTDWPSDWRSSSTFQPCGLLSSKVRTEPPRCRYRSRATLVFDVNETDAWPLSFLTKGRQSIVLTSWAPSRTVRAQRIEYP